jgi:hypothetical protein
VAYLGHVISTADVAMDRQKVHTVLDWPMPRIVCAVRTFLGLVSYYHPFIQVYGSITVPLARLLRKEGFHWDADAEAAFRSLQQALTTVPVLQLPDFDWDFMVECDTSGCGFGAVLHIGPLAFFSKPIAAQHYKLVAYECELIGLIQVVRHWRVYLWGRSFVVRIEHYSLKYLLDQKLATIPQHQWVSKLLGFDFRIEFKPGSSNVVADALSRHDVEASAKLAALSTPSFHLFDTLRREIDDTPELHNLREEVQVGHHGDKWRVVDGLITMSGCVYLPPALASLAAMLQHAHDVGHEGVEHTLHRLRVDFHLPSALSMVHDHVRACVTCQQNKSEHLHPASLLQPLDVSFIVWADVAMDFVEGFRASMASS